MKKKMSSKLKKELLKLFKLELKNKKKKNLSAKNIKKTTNRFMTKLKKNCKKSFKK